MVQLGKGSNRVTLVNKRRRPVQCKVRLTNCTDYWTGCDEASSFISG